MAMPKVRSLYGPVLRAMPDGCEHSSEEITSEKIRDSVAVELNLNDADLAQVHPGSRRNVYVNRVAGALRDLNIGTAIFPVRNGAYRLLDRGKILRSCAKEFSRREATDKEWLG